MVSPWYNFFSASLHWHCNFQSKLDQYFPLWNVFLHSWILRMSTLDSAPLIFCYKSVTGSCCEIDRILRLVFYHLCIKFNKTQSNISRTVAYYYAGAKNKGKSVGKLIRTLSKRYCYLFYYCKKNWLLHCFRRKLSRYVIIITLFENGTEFFYLF